MRWSQCQPDADESLANNPDLWMEWDEEFTGCRLSHTLSVRMRQTGEVTSLPEAACRRLFCHVLLARLPENALGEACESLSGMYEFYRSLPHVQPLALPRPEPIQAAWGEERERPVFQLTED